jgi:hypothetical protein
MLGADLFELLDPEPLKAPLFISRYISSADNTTPVQISIPSKAFLRVILLCEKIQTVA